jgi:hypothetical protein
MARWDEINVAQSQKGFFHFESNLKKKVPNHYLEHLLFGCKVIKEVILLLFLLDLSQTKKQF